MRYNKRMETWDDITLSAKIANYIAETAPVYDFTPAQLAQAKTALGDKAAEYRAKGWLGENFRTFWTIKTLLDDLGLWQVAPESYLTQLFGNAKALSPAYIEDNPYVKNIPFCEQRIGDFLLTNSYYEGGELLQYDEPDFYAAAVVPKLGYFERRVYFPTIYECAMPWMSVCPSEIASMEEHFAYAHGRVLVLGLGLGYYPYMIEDNPSITQIVIVEVEREVLDLFRANILPHFRHPEKIKLVKSDAIWYLQNTQDGDFDVCFADIWEGQEDGAEHYLNIKPHEARMPHTRFGYWIEKEILWYLQQLEGDNHDD